MILATQNNGHRDGELILVHPNHKRALSAKPIAANLQEALENWDACELALQKKFHSFKKDPLCKGSFDLDLSNLLAPLPRSYQFLDASAYVHHVELARKARGEELPKTYYQDPLMYQGISHQFDAWNSCVDKRFVKMGLDFEAEVAVITDETPLQCSKSESGNHIKLLMLINDWSLRKLIPSELEKGFGFLHGKPACSCSPFAITPDELGQNWEESKVHLPITSTLNHDTFGQPNAGIDMVFDFSDLISHASKTRHLSAGTVLGSGTVSNHNESTGSSCIVEKRMLQKLKGEVTMDFMQSQDRIEIEMRDTKGKSLFGKIDQVVES